jgi:hypothetical protein
MERKFATLYGKIRSVLNAAGFPTFLCSRLWSYAAKCVTQLENTIIDSSTMTASEKIKVKLDNRGYPCIFIAGYTEDHASSVYVFFNLNNQAIFMSRVTKCCLVT